MTGSACIAFDTVVDARAHRHAYRIVCIYYLYILCYAAYARLMCLMRVIYYWLLGRHRNHLGRWFASFFFLKLLVVVTALVAFPDL